MGTLIAKTKGRGGDFFKVLTSADFFEIPEDMEEHEYEDGYLLGEEEWHRISDFSDKDYFPDFLGEPFNSVDYNQIQLNEYGNIEYIFEHQQAAFFFQKIAPKQLMRKSYLQVSQEPRILRNRRFIVLENDPSAIYLKDRDVLLFRNLFAIKSIFKGIEELYKEATNEEVEEFLENRFIELSDDFSAEQVKRANRKRISAAMETIRSLSRRDRRNMFSYIQEYCPDLPLNDDENAFQISSETTLKHLLYGIDQRFYTTPRGGEKRLANSITTKW